VLVARRCREVVPHVRLDVILWDAPAQQVHASKPCHIFGYALLGSFQA
jgi:hypothetical protein